MCLSLLFTGLLVVTVSAATTLVTNCLPWQLQSFVECTTDNTDWCVTYWAPQAPDKFNPKVTLQTCGIIQMLYETKHIETIIFGKSVMAHISKIEPKTSK